MAPTASPSAVGPYRARSLPAAAAVFLAAALAAPPPLSAQEDAGADGPVAVDLALRARFGFLGPRIHKVGHGINFLRLADLDGSGRASILLHHPRRARLEVLRLEGEEVRGESLGIAGELRGLAVGDVDGDGVPDLLLLSARGRLEVRLEGGRGRALPELDVGEPLMQDSLRAGDLTGDGRADAVVLTRDGLRVVTHLAEGGRVSPPDPIQEQRVGSFHLVDADGDGLLDVVLAVGADRPMPLWVKRGEGEGRFGPWLLFEVPVLRAVFPGAGHQGRPTLATIQGPHRRVVEVVLARTDDPARPSVLLTTLPERGTRRGPVPFAHGDVDGDGRRDLVLADPDRARLTVLYEAGDRFRVATVPALAGVSSLDIADVDGDGRSDILMASPEEDALAYRGGDQAEDAFPRRLPSLEKPVAAAVAAPGEVLFLARTERREGRLCGARLGADGSWTADVLLDIGRLAADPTRLLVGDLTGNGAADVAYVVPGDGLGVLLRREDGTFHKPEAAAAGFTRRIDDGALSLVEWEGKPALKVVRDRFARVFRFDASGEPVILAQEGGPEGIGAMALAAVLEDGSQVVLDRAANKLVRQVPGGAPVSVDVPDVGASHLLAHHGAALLVGDRGVARIPFHEQGWEIRQVRLHEPPRDRTTYYNGFAADLDGSGSPELALLDDHISGIHVLVPDPQGERLQPALVFPVFESPRQTRGGGGEPRETVAADVDGDGRTDLILICHDRVLIYLQEP